MPQVLEAQVINEVANLAREMGYRVTLEPTRIPRRNPWRDGLSSFVRRGRHRPDLLVEHGPSFAIVEVKSRPVLLGGVVQSQKYADHFDAPVVLCVRDDSFSRTPASVKNYAQMQDVRLCPVSEVRGILRELLG